MQLRSVLISDAVDAACVELLQLHAINVGVRTKLPPAELIKELQNHDALIVRSDTKVTAEVLAGAPHLKVVGRAGTGVDNIDLDAATKRGVLVMNTPGGNSISACELTCALIAGLARHVAPACAALKQGSWERKQHAGTELHGKTLAILGLGRIGREVALRMQAFGMKTIGYDPIISTAAAREFHVEKLELEEIWPQADYISVHTPLIAQTRNLINAAVLSRCRRGVRVVNVARGGIVDEEGLLASLKSGQCGGAALDVFTEEPPRSSALLELVAHPRVLATPHLGASTAEAQQRVAIEIAEQFVALTKGEAVTGIVNAPTMSTALQATTTPWMKLAQHLGCIASALLGEVPRASLHVDTLGCGTPEVACLSTGALLGLLAGRVKHTLNLVNAPLLARDAGVTVTTSQHTSVPAAMAQCTAGLRVTVCCDGKLTRSVLGTVRAGLPVLVAIDEQTCFPAPALVLQGNLLLFESRELQASLPTLVAAVAGAGSLVESVSLAGVTGERAGYVGVHTTSKLAAAACLLPAGVTLLAQHLFT